jgi:hypothetical protein
MHVSICPAPWREAEVDARRVVFERDRATKLDCLGRREWNRRPFLLRARRAVVLAGGAFGTRKRLDAIRL